MDKAAKDRMNFLVNNMPQAPFRHFEEAFRDESWTWAGFAFILKERYSVSDIEDLVYYLNVGQYTKSKVSILEKVKNLFRR